MNEPHEILSRNIGHLLREMGLTVTDLARRTGLNQPTVYRIAKGMVRNPERKTVQAIADFFGYTIDEMYREALWVPRDMDGQRNVPETLRSTESGYTQNGGNGHVLKMLPLIPLSDAAKWIRTMDSSQVRVSRYVAISSDASDKAFFVTQEDDSMIADAGSVSIMPGYMVLVDPLVKHVSGKIVAAIPKGAVKPTIKMYVEDAGRTYLKPLNTRYPLLEIDSRCIIVGTVTKIQINI